MKGQEGVKERDGKSGETGEKGIKGQKAENRRQKADDRGLLAAGAVSVVSGSLSVVKEVKSKRNGKIIWNCLPMPYALCLLNSGFRLLAPNSMLHASCPMPWALAR